MNAWYVYIVRCADNTLYTGVAKDAKARVSLHNAGQGAKYTFARRPVVLVYVETATDHGAALRREYEIKQLRSAAKRHLIADSAEVSGNAHANEHLRMAGGGR